MIRNILGLDADSIEISLNWIADPSEFLKDNSKLKL